MRLITEHWELKLVALAIAVALWLYTSGQVRAERTITVQVRASAVAALPDRYRVSAVEPQAFSVQVSIPESQVAALRAQVVPRFEIAAESLAAGEQIFPITAAALGLEGDVRIVRVVPETVRDIRVRFDAIAEDYLALEVPRLAGIPEGIEAAVVLDRTRVRVRGTREQLDALKGRGARIAFAPLRLDDVDPGLAQERQDVLKLVAREAPCEVVDPITATVTLRPSAGSRLVVSLPIQVLMPPGAEANLRVVLAQPQVSLAVRGPENLLKALRPESELTAYVDLHEGFAAGAAREVPVRILGPGWLVSDPLSVRVAIVPAGERR
jgi:hypothetical protein